MRKFLSSRNHLLQYLAQIKTRHRHLQNRFVVIYKRKAIVYNSTPIHKDLKFAESQLGNFISQLMVA